MVTGKILCLSVTADLVNTQDYALERGNKVIEYLGELRNIHALCSRCASSHVRH